MKEREVMMICGKPDEIRKFSGRGLHNEAYRWAYGVVRPGSFTRVGVVVFNKEGDVIRASCPTRLAEATRRKVVEEAVANAYGINCVVEAVWEDDTVIHYRHTARVSLVNRGYHPWVFWGKGELYENLLVEVYDANMLLLLSDDNARYSSAAVDGMPPHSLRLETLSGICREFPIFLSDLDYGVPAPGVYYLRVAFPIEKDKYYASNLHQFQIK